MNSTQQERLSTFFIAVEIPQELVKPLTGYVQVITTSPKNSIKYFTEEEDSRIARWKLYQTVQIIPKYGKTFTMAVFQRILTFIDRRYPICLAVDDFVCRRYGKQAYHCDYFYSNAHGGIVWGNALVDVTIRNNQLACPVTFEIHYRRGSAKLWERGLRQVQRLVSQLLANGINPTRIWTLADCSYGNRQMEQRLRELGGFYLLGLPKSRQVELFGRKVSLAQYFATLPKRYLTVAGRQYCYKISTANLNEWGRRRLLAIHMSGDQWRYYACNKLNCQAKTLLLRHRDR